MIVGACMELSDFVALDYKLKHAKSKKAVLESYPDLKGKTVKQVLGMILVNTMIITGKDFKKQKQSGLRRKWSFIIKRK